MVGWMLVSGDRHDIFSLESIGLTDSSVGSRSSFQTRAVTKLNGICCVYSEIPLKTDSHLSG
jgi:hypothetical protein